MLIAVARHKSDTLSGNVAYKYSSCAPVAAGVCALDNIVVPNGSSTVFYRYANAPAGEFCTAHQQTRTCTNGVLSGGVSSVSVQSETSFGDREKSQMGHTAISGSVSPAPAPAPNYVYVSCSNTASCALDGITLAHGSSTVFYKQHTVAFGATCASVLLSRTCLNGAFSGDTSYQYASCSVSPPSASLTQSLANALAALESAVKALIALLGL